MLKHRETTPFIFGSVAVGQDNFTDRENDSKRLLANFENRINTILISPRRWGKTSLVKHVAQLSNNKRLFIVYMDIFSCKNDKEFFDLYSSTIVKQTSSKVEDWINNTKEFLYSLRPKFSFGLDPTTDFSFSLSFDNKESVTDILNLPEKIAHSKDIRIVVCIDEFQQILDFDDSQTFQKILRTVWQHHQSVSYCLFGSKKHLMSLLFEKKSLPFYKFGDIIYLQKIPQDKWIKYIIRQFNLFDKTIDESFAIRICQAVDNHSSYVQQLSYIIFINTEDVVTEEIFSKAIDDLINQNINLFIRDTEDLTLYQTNFMKALCDGIEQGFTSKNIINKYNLGSSSNVTRAKQSLEQKEIIDITGNKITILDPVYRMWFKRVMMNK